MKNFRSPILTVNGIIYEKGKVLLPKRAVRPFCGFWELPGGHVEYGETVEEALKRECKEELGLKIKIKKLLGVYSSPNRGADYHAVTVVYLLEKGRGEICLSKENSDFEYFSIKRLPSKMAFDHLKILKDFKKDSKSI